MPRDITKAMKDKRVKNPSAAQAVCSNTQRSEIIVTTVTGMLSNDTKMSAAARFRMNKLVMV